MWKQYQPTEIFFGEGQLESLENILQQRRIENVLIIADPFIVQAGIAQKIAALSPKRITGIFSEIEPNPTLQNIDQCVEMIRSTRSTFLLAVGGGSAMDCAKCAAAAFAMGCCARDLMDGKEITDALPLAAIPTTAGTSSEVTAGAVLSDREAHRKDAIFSPLLFAKFAIVDPQLTYSCPRSVTASSGIDVLMHALDALSSKKATPLTDTLAIQAVRLVFAHLEHALQDGNNSEARKGMSTACVLAGMAFSQTGTTGTHATSYCLTEQYGIPHGEACAFTAEAWLSVNGKARADFSDIVHTMGFDSLEGLLEGIRELKKSCRFRTTFQEAGIPADALGSIAESTVSAGNYGNNLVQLTVEEVKELLSQYAI